MTTIRTIHTHLRHDTLAAITEQNIHMVKIHVHFNEMQK